MYSSTQSDAGHLPLSFPAILINAKQKDAASRDSYAVHQKEHNLAVSRKKQEDKQARGGKRRERRKENALLAHNPHVTLPSRIDLLPPAPRYVSTFAQPSSRSPAAAAIRAASIPDTVPPPSEPTSSEAGQYTLSLKGVRSLLRGRGRRSEVIIQVVEKELRPWSGCELEDGEENTHDHGYRVQDISGYGNPRIIDSSIVHVKSEGSSKRKSTRHNTVVEYTPHRDQQEMLDARLSDRANTRLPQPFTTHSSSSPEFLARLLESIYSSSSSGSGSPHTHRQAIIELVRTPGHLVWAIADGWERLIVHLLVRYYGLISFSQTLPCVSPEQMAGQSALYRITHILHPIALRPPAANAAADLMTPEHSGVDTDFSTSASEVGFDSTSEVESDLTSEGETETERDSNDEGDSTVFDTTITEVLGHRPGDVPDYDSDAEGNQTLSLSHTSSPLLSPRLLSNLKVKRSSTGNRINSAAKYREESDGEASDEEGYAESTTSMLDSLILGDSSIENQGIAQPFTSEFDIPLHVDLFPERRRNLDSNIVERKGKTPFFEYIYGQ